MSNACLIVNTNNKTVNIKDINNLSSPIVSVKKKKQYDPAQLLEACAEVRIGGISISAAAKKFGVTRKTLADHVHGKIEDGTLPGIERMLTTDEETALVDYIEYMSSHNMPLRHSDIRGTVTVSSLVTIHNDNMVLYHKPMKKIL